MERDSLALFISMISLILSIFYFLSFYSFKNSDMIKFDNQNLYLNKYNTFLCDNLNDLSTCKQVFYSNKMISLGSNNDGDNLYLNNNTLICDDVNNSETCACLSNNCNFLKNLYHFTFIDKPISFSSSKYGMMYGARALPYESSSTFTFSTWININLVDLDKWRSIFVWRKFDKTVNPAILISPKKWSTCNSKIDIRFSSLYENKDNNKELEGTFNIFNGNHGHCINDTSNYYFKWFHLAIVGKDNLIIYYINGSVVDEVNLNFNLQLGSQEDEIYIGGSPEYSSEGIVLSKTRWFSKPLTKLEIKNLVNEPYE